MDRGEFTKQEDELAIKEMSENYSFSDLLDILDSVDTIDGVDELRSEFNESIDSTQTSEDFNSNIK